MKQPAHAPQYHCLDISEYLLKEYSPYLKPHLPEHHHQISSPSLLSYDISPIVQGLGTLIKTPRELIHEKTDKLQFKQDLNQFILQQQLSTHIDQKKYKFKKIYHRSRINSIWYPSNHQLENIVQFCQQPHSNCQDQLSNQQYSNIHLQRCQHNNYNNLQDKLFQQQKQSTNIDELPHQQPMYLQWYVLNPKKELLSKLKSILQNQLLLTDLDKINQIKNIFSNYIFDFQKYYFEDSINQLNGTIVHIINTIVKGIDHSFKRIIGGLTFQKRRQKLAKYIEKKKKRVWRKKVNYDCRKKVADGRLRIKGKFVTYQQARQQLGMTTLQGYNSDEIKNMLEKKNCS